MGKTFFINASVYPLMWNLHGLPVYLPVNLFLRFGERNFSLRQQISSGSCQDPVFAKIPFQLFSTEKKGGWNEQKNNCWGLSGTCKAESAHTWSELSLTQRCCYTHQYLGKRCWEDWLFHSFKANISFSLLHRIWSFSYQTALDCTGTIAKKQRNHLWILQEKQHL